MGRSGKGAKTIPPVPTGGRADRQQGETAGPGEQSGGSTTGAPSSGPPDAAAVCRAVRALREVVGALAPGDDPHQIVVLPAGALLPILDQAIRLLGEPPTRVA